MKNKAKLSTLILTLTAVLTGCTEPAAPVDNRDTEISNIVLDKHYASMFFSKGEEAFNEEITLSPVVYPLKNCERKIKWTSSNPDVATVDQNGNVKAVGEGTSEVTVSNDDGSVSASTHIIVNDMTTVKMQYCNTRQDDIFAAQRKSTFVVPDIITAHETFTEVLTKNGEIMSKNYFTQDLTTSKKNAFVQLDINELEWRVEGGAPVASNMQYVFYTTDQYETYLFKTSGLSKNYMVVNQSEFIGSNKLNALKQVCNHFFRSGEKIVLGNYDDILGQNTSGYIDEGNGTKRFGRFENTPGQLAFDIDVVYSETADDSDEKDSNIPAGTPYKFYIYDRFVFENNFVVGKYIEQKLVYKIGDDEYEDVYYVDYFYEARESIEFPNKDNFAKVDSASDL